MFHFIKERFTFVLIALLFKQCLSSPTLSKDDLFNKIVPPRNGVRLPAYNGLIQEGNVDKEWCDPVLGCLYITDEWYTNTRPINVLPDSRDKIDTRFYLHTRVERNTDMDYVVSADDLTSLATSPFDVSKPTKFIVHGFIDTGHTKWVKDLASQFLDYGDYNVLRVDWGHGSQPMYDRATANSRVAGLEIGYFVNTLITTWNLNPANVHCLGHSLGAHVCGYGGEQVENMGRITGMDPAGPYYTGTPYFVHLDPTDAIYVDVIHTDADSIFVLGYGTAQPMGNIDFYPNSGHDQPGCDPVSIAIELITDDMVEGGRDIFACSHLRSIQYFAESLNSPTCNWLGHECHDYDSFEQGNCYSCTDDETRCAYFGIQADQYVAKSRQFALFYLDTDHNDPYCMQHYEVSILTAYPEEAESWVMGRLYIWIYGDSQEIIEKVQITNNHERIDHGEIKTNLFISHQDVGHAVRIELKWVYDDNVLNPGTYCWPPFCNRSLYVQSVQVSAINHYPESERETYTSLACSQDGSMTKIKDGHKESFMASVSCESLEGH